jgi:glutathione S-transferase
MRLLGIPWSTNVERVTLALAYKRVEAELVEVDPSDRSQVRQLSGQELVPVLIDGDDVVADSLTILRHLARGRTTTAAGGA